MAMKFLSKASKKPQQVSLKYHLHRHLSGFEKGRSKDVVHASSLTKSEGFCPREYALATATKAKTKDEWLTTSDAVTFQIGRDMERNVVNWFADMGMAFCHWKCNHCGTMHMNQLRPLGCSSCKSQKFIPIEMRFTSKSTGASAGVDMVLAIGNSKMLPVELKTIDKDKFKDQLKAPLAEHKQRTNLYLRILEDAEEPVANLISHKEARILYVSKGGYGCLDGSLAGWGLTDKFSPFKEFTITRDDVLTQLIWEKAKAVKDYREGIVGMPCGICQTSMDKRATKCSMRTACFGGAFPPKYDWNSI